MKKLLFILCICSTSFWSCDKTNSPSNEKCADNSNVCLTLNGQAINLNGKINLSLDNQLNISGDDGTNEISIDIGTQFEVRKYQLTKGSMSSVYSRITIYNKSTQVQYKSKSGELEVTSADNRTLTGKFTGIFENQSDKTQIEIKDGKFIGVTE